MRIEGGDARYQGGELHAAGTLKTADTEAAITLRVKDLPLSRIAPQLGIPAEWAVKGTVTGEAAIGAHSGGLRTLRRDGAGRSWNAGAGRRGVPVADRQRGGDWTPDRALLQNVRVDGQDARLTAAGEVDTSGGAPFIAGRFRATGTLEALRPGAVAQIGRLVTLRRLMDGRWDAGRASLRFQAQGTVGQLAQASASGRVRLEGLRFRPAEGSEPVERLRAGCGGGAGARAAGPE